MTETDRRIRALSFRPYYLAGKKANKMTKRDACLEYLERYGSITPREAYEGFDSMRLATIISDLREEGYDIITTYPPTAPRHAIYKWSEEGDTDD